MEQISAISVIRRNVLYHHSKVPPLLYFNTSAPMKKQTVILRNLREDETELLKDFLYEAIFVPEGMEAPDRSIIEKPELSL